MPKLFTLALLLASSVLTVPSHGVDAGVGETATSAAAWVVDAPHTKVQFSVNHFFTPVTGGFDEFEVTLDYDAENPEESSVEARIAVAGVNTGNERRDNHLRSADFFAAEEHPYITFRSTSVTQSSDGWLIARGPLTIRGTTREIELPIELLGVQEIPGDLREMLGGAERIASFRAATKIDRGEFGVGTGSWAATLVVGGEVEIEILVEAHYK